MLSGEVLLLLAVFCDVRAIVAPIDEDDPELYVEWEPPSDVSYYRDYTNWASFTGNLLAGRAEFPYLVRIESTDQDTQNWGIGNLITFFHVLTTARQVDLHEIVRSDRRTQYIDGVRILYCANYLFEDYKYNNLRNYDGYDVFDHDVYESGTRYVRFMHKHSKYDPFHLNYDIGIMRLHYPIRPMPPLTDYMPIWYDFVKDEITDPSLERMTEQRRVCYIASYGMGWRNWQRPPFVGNYKVKYRVYWMDPDNCVSYYNLYPKVLGQVDQLDYDAARDDMMCFRPRAAVGAICDQDRGAPLVCDYKVYGFVSRGALFEYCNNRLPIPVFVTKAKTVNMFYQRILGVVFRPFYHERSAGSKKRFGCLFIIIFFLPFYP